MVLLSVSNQIKLIYIVVMLGFMQVGNVKTFADKKIEKENKTLEVVTEKVGEQKSFKKELKVNKTNEFIEPAILSYKGDVHTEAQNMEKHVVIQTESRPKEEQNRFTEHVLSSLKEDGKKTDTLQSATKESYPSPSQHFHREGEQFLLNDEDNISESLKTGFYFFLALSSGTVSFILFKIYRLRLSRVERKYGVQGDRSTQELTPLPISIEDGQSDDDDDQTLFEIQRQNLRIL